MFAGGLGQVADDATMARAAELEARLGHASPQDIIEAAVRAYEGRITLVSSFGTEAAVLLDLVAEVDPATPVLFLDTGMLFSETLDYRDILIERLGLTDVRTLAPEEEAVRAEDPDSFLWQSAPDACCALRKVAPLARALEGFAAWINGRKRYQAVTRRRLPVVEADGTRIKFSPLASWGRAEIEAWFERRALPNHPLAAQGFPSIGCMPCTSRVKPGEDIRAGRWRGQGKIECGIHVK
ncbi:phosphoadenosine phosphosulfate reductase [Agaricicola taiwanensis]|uniref:Adenosine 5'-phosphosulfate reductase n=1 Tax=Agaricicola taiwanensis TaxID=591372 RepID=A0A8J2VLS9_9RHOB|nr:phosphoadenylyl-sulfate reductase [Agaricicola taiwanensis]GGE30655.1 phosphoadenosine phosphosulfate reductase [Agaricicola taiwanensis]